MSAAPADPAAVSNAELSVELCGPADRSDQARLFNAVFKKRLEAGALSWRYDRNPHGASVSALARAPGGEPVCGYACSPRIALCRGDESTRAPIGQTGDVMTHPSWRKRGIFSSLDRRCMEETALRGWPVVFGLPNRRSAHIFLQLGWDRVGTVRPWTHFLRADAAARAVRGREGRVRGALLPVAILRCRRARRAFARAGAAYTARPLERFPEDVVQLSRAVERRHALMVRRDAAYLNWRFVDTSARLHRTVGVRDAAGALAGYATVQLPRAGEPTGFLVDALAPERAALCAALSAALELLEQAGAAAVQATAVDGSAWSATLRGAGFLAPRPANHLIVIRCVHRPEHPLAVASADASSWYLTDGDRDDETMG